MQHIDIWGKRPCVLTSPLARTYWPMWLYDLMWRNIQLPLTFALDDEYARPKHTR